MFDLKALTTSDAVVIQMRYDVEDLDAATRLMQAADALDLTYDLTKRFDGFTLTIYASGAIDTDT